MFPDSASSKRHDWLNEHFMRNFRAGMPPDQRDMHARMRLSQTSSMGKDWVKIYFRSANNFNLIDTHDIPLLGDRNKHIAVAQSWLKRKYKNLTDDFVVCYE